MPPPPLRLRALPGAMAVCHLPAGDPVPSWLPAGGALVSVTRTRAELSIVCEESAVPADVTAERGFRALEVEGPIPMNAVGVLARLAVPLADAGIAIFVVSTYETDYVLVHEERVNSALTNLRDAGCEVLAPA